MDRLWNVMNQDAAAGTPRPGNLSPYLSGVALLVVGVIARLLLDPILGDRVIFLFLVPALFAASMMGGLRPGLAISILGAIAGSLILSRYGIILGNVIDGVLFLGLGIAIAVTGERLGATHRRALEMADHVREREAFLQSILNTGPDAMIVIDEHGVIHSFSRAAERLFGWQANEVVGKNISLLMPSPHREAHDGYLQRYGRTHVRRMIGTGRVELAEKKDGGAFPMELSVGELEWGGHKYFTGFVKDLTERREADRRLQSLQSDLVHVSRLSAMGEMASALAHELNQPLSAISNYLRGGRRLLEAKHPDSEVIAPLDRAAEQTLRAGEIIRRLRDFVSRGESEHTIESLPKLLDEATALALTGAKERSVKAKSNRDPAVDLVLVDKIQVQQVVLNLVRNALEAMDGTPRRELLIAVTPEPGDMAGVSVADTGCGISPEVMDQLFRPFVTSKGQHGMGVGLSICKTIIEAHGGRIWAEPNTGGGTVFHFTVPLARSSEVV